MLAAATPIPECTARNKSAEIDSTIVMPIFSSLYASTRRHPDVGPDSRPTSYPAPRHAALGSCSRLGAQERPPERALVTITPALAAELALLTQALDLSGTDVAETLTRLAARAQAAVDSYLGLSVEITTHLAAFALTLLNEGTQTEHIRTSLLVPLSATPAKETQARVGTMASASMALILYAATPGAFIDLAADLAWLTGRAAVDFRLDENRSLPQNYNNPRPLRAMSIINQALGVLIGRGATLEEAERDLAARADRADIDLPRAATFILGSPQPLRPEDS